MRKLTGLTGLTGTTPLPPANGQQPSSSSSNPGREAPPSSSPTLQPAKRQNETRNFLRTRPPSDATPSLAKDRPAPETLSVTEEESLRMKEESVRAAMAKTDALLAEMEELHKSVMNMPLEEDRAPALDSEGKGRFSSRIPRLQTHFPFTPPQRSPLSQSMTLPEESPVSTTSAPQLSLELPGEEAATAPLTKTPKKFKSTGDLFRRLRNPAASKHKNTTATSPVPDRITTGKAAIFSSFSALRNALTPKQSNRTSDSRSPSTVLNLADTTNEQIKTATALFPPLKPERLQEQAKSSLTILGRWVSSPKSEKVLEIMGISAEEREQRKKIREGIREKFINGEWSELHYSLCEGEANLNFFRSVNAGISFFTSTIERFKVQGKISKKTTTLSRGLRKIIKAAKKLQKSDNQDLKILQWGNEHAPTLLKTSPENGKPDKELILKFDKSMKRIDSFMEKALSLYDPDHPFFRSKETKV